MHKQMLRAPLLDNTVPEDKLKDWIHARTMHVHGFLDEQVRCFAGHVTSWHGMRPFSRPCIGYLPGGFLQ